MGSENVALLPVWPSMTTSHLLSMLTSSPSSTHDTCYNFTPNFHPTSLQPSPSLAMKQEDVHKIFRIASGTDGVSPGSFLHCADPLDPAFTWIFLCEAVWSLRLHDIQHKSKTGLCSLSTPVLSLHHSKERHQNNQNKLVGLTCNSVETTYTRCP